jgi:hypothetical protein
MAKIKKTDSTKTDLVPKKGGSPSREVLYAYASQYTQEAFDKALDLMRHCPNENVALGAIKLVLERSLPAIKALELSGKNGDPITVQLINDYLSTRGANATSVPGAEGSNTLQGTHLAQEGKEDINIIGEDGARSA